MLRRLYYDARVRDVFWQVAVAAGLVFLAVYFVKNASDNMVKAGIAAGFDFLWRTSGVAVAFVLTGYKSSDSIWALFWAGVANTLLATAVSIVFASLLGFAIGLGRLSSHWLLSTLAGGYVEFVRNIPLLLFVLFCYFGVIANLPAPKDSFGPFSLFFLNNRGLTVPRPETWAPFLPAVLAIAGGVVLTLVFWQLSSLRQRATGRELPVGWVAALLLGVLPVLALVLACRATAWDLPQPGKFNLRGGTVIIPEFVALVVALVTYSAGFIAEIVRSGITAVSKGQKEAAAALGLRPGQVLRLVVIPQAMRIMIPPMTSQYLNVLKNSSFGAAIAYPDVVSLFMGSALTNTGQAVEIVAMVLAVYLVFGLAVAAFMNWFNARLALVTR